MGMARVHPQAGRENFVKTGSERHRNFMFAEQDAMLLVLCSSAASEVAS